MEQKHKYICKNCKLNFSLKQKGTILCPRCYSQNVKENKTKL